MWIWRKTQRIAWTEKNTNESVWLEIGVEEKRNATTNSDKKEARILWTYYAIRWIGKRNDAGMWGGKEEKRTTKEKMDG